MENIAIQLPNSTKQVTNQAQQIPQTTQNIWENTTISSLNHAKISSDRNQFITNFLGDQDEDLEICDFEEISSNNNNQISQNSVKKLKQKSQDHIDSHRSGCSDNTAHSEEDQNSPAAILKRQAAEKIQEYEEQYDLNKNQNWQLKENKKGVQLHTYFNDQTEEICSRVEAEFQLKNPEAFAKTLELLKTIESKQKFDPMFEKGQYLEDLGNDVTLQHWLLKGQAVVAQRHFTLLSQVKQENNITYLVGCGVESEHEKTLKYSIKNAVRVLVNLAGWRIENLGKNKYKFIYLQKSNPNGKLPYFIKKATAKFSMEMVKNVKKIAEKF